MARVLLAVPLVQVAAVSLPVPLITSLRLSPMPILSLALVCRYAPSLPLEAASDLTILFTVSSHAPSITIPPLLLVVASCVSMAVITAPGLTSAIAALQATLSRTTCVCNSALPLFPSTTVILASLVVSTAPISCQMRSLAAPALPYVQPAR